MKTENSTVVFDNMLLSEQASNIDLSFTRWRHGNVDVYYTSESQIDLPKKNFRKISSKNTIYKQTLRDIKLFFHDRVGLVMP